jgi:Ca-activated chloride channel homolog
MLDTSRSAKVKLDEIERAATAFIEQLRDDDEVMVVSFDDRVTFDTSFTSDRAALIQAIHTLRTGGGTRLYDAIGKVLAEKLSKMEGRKAIVLFSDGIDTASMSGTPEETLEMVKTMDAILYPLQYEASRDDPLFKPNEFGRATRFLRRIADASGGRFYQAENTANLRQAFSMIAHDLRYQYAVSYYPTNEVRDGSFRRIKVSVNRPNVVVRTREGYKAEQPQ